MGGQSSVKFVDGRQPVRDLVAVVRLLDVHSAGGPESLPLLRGRDQRLESFGERLLRRVPDRGARRRTPPRSGGGARRECSRRQACRHPLDGEDAVPAGVELVDEDVRLRGSARVPGRGGRSAMSRSTESSSQAAITASVAFARRLVGACTIRTRSVSCAGTGSRSARGRCRPARRGRRAPTASRRTSRRCAHLRATRTQAPRASSGCVEPRKWRADFPRPNAFSAGNCRLPGRA